MASVLNSKAKFYQYASRDNDDIDRHIESEADIFIKELAHKQLDTNVTLEQQLNQEKKFISSHKYQPVTELTRGNVSHEELKSLSSYDFKNDPQSEDSPCSISTTNISRHVRELALSVKPNSIETKLLEFAITCNTIGNVKKDNRPIDHPINQLSQIEHDLFGHLSQNSDVEKTARTVLRKRKQLLEAVSEPIEVQRKPQVNRKNSGWDVTNFNTDLQCKNVSKMYTCKKQKLFTICDGKIIDLTEENNNEREKNENSDATSVKICLDTTSGQENHDEKRTLSRLSIEDIRKIPKFQNYTRGAISETLYLKNLSPQLTEKDLISLFSKYQQENKPCITCTLMKRGKMRGQAFIRFHDTEIASRALEDINGTILNGKPLIVQFSSACPR